MKDTREHLCDPLDTYLPWAVKKQLEEVLKGRKNVDGTTFNVVMNFLLRKIRGKRTDEKKKGEEGGVEREERKAWLNRV